MIDDEIPVFDGYLEDHPTSYLVSHQENNPLTYGISPLPHFFYPTAFSSSRRSQWFSAATLVKWGPVTWSHESQLHSAMDVAYYHQNKKA